MKLSVEGTQEEIKEILSAIRISQEDRSKVLISAKDIGTGVINPLLSKRVNKSRLYIGG